MGPPDGCRCVLDAVIGDFNLGVKRVFGEPFFSCSAAVDDQIDDCGFNCDDDDHEFVIAWRMAIRTRRAAVVEAVNV